MSVASVSTIWKISCDHDGCTRATRLDAPTCMQALEHAELHHWLINPDGTTLCPAHRGRP